MDAYSGAAAASIAEPSIDDSQPVRGIRECDFQVTTPLATTEQPQQTQYRCHNNRSGTKSIANSGSGCCRRQAPVSRPSAGRQQQLIDNILIIL